MSTNERCLRHESEIISDKSLWKKGPDGKFYATEEILRIAQEEWLKKNTYKLPPDKIIKKEEPPSLINPNEIQPPEILPSLLY